MIHIGIIGGASLTGLELIRQLSEREDIAFDFITSNTFDGQDIADVFPQVSLNNLSFSNQTIEEIKKSPPEVLFLCVDNGKAMKWVESLINTNVKIIDLSADFRFENFETYESVYKIPHSYKHKMVYGLSELYANEIIKAKIVANPGCFATASILSLAPLLNKNIVQQVILDGKSGVSGAGITNKDVNNFNHLSQAR